MAARIVIARRLAALAVALAAGSTPARAGDWEDCNGTDPAAGIRGCSAIIARGEREAHVAHYNRGIEYENRGVLDKALIDYDKAIELKPDYAKAYNNRGNIYQSLKLYDRAIVDFDRAIAIDPKDAAPYYNRGATWDMKQQYERAIADYDAAIRLKPNNAAYFNNRGVAYRKLRQFDQAVRLRPGYTKAIDNRREAEAARAESRQ